MIRKASSGARTAVAALLFAGVLLSGCAASNQATIPENINVDRLLPASPGDPRLDAQASAAYLDGDYQRSAELYADWLRAQPDDANAWYNYSCTLALMGDTLRAMEALVVAAEAGFTNARHCEGDPDLASYHGNERFQHALGLMRAAQEADALGANTLHYYPQTRFGRYALYLPGGTDPLGSKPLPVLLFLHGRTRKPADMKFIANRMNAEGFAVILPEAPYAVDGYRGGFEYWPTDRSALQELNGEIVQELARLSVSAEYRDILQDAAQYTPLDLDRVIVAGFSMGATTSYSVVQQAPDAFIGAAIFAGTIRPGMNDPVLFEGFRDKGGRVLVMHGEEDRPQFAQAAFDLLQQAGVDSELKFYPETGHQITEAMLNDFIPWAKELLGE